jgi:hypothetical protein
MSTADPKQQAPPFAKLIDMREELVLIYCGAKAWSLARPGPRKATVNFDELSIQGDRVASLAFPRRADPKAYRWPVKGKRVVIFAGGEHKDVTDYLAWVLLVQGSYCVGVYDDTGKFIEYDNRIPRTKNR